MEPIIAIILGLLVLLIVAFVAWPQNGLIAIWRRHIWNANKVLTEDALKLIYQLEEKSIYPTINSIEEGLSISQNNSDKLINKLKKSGLISIIDNEIQLKKEGRNYSLQVIRNHRLWESFLANETATKEVDWHTEADHAEHTLSPTQADELAAKIGNPLVDPHGDPIPTADGIMPDRKGIPITELGENEYAEIIHLEDEPIEVYKHIVDAGLYPGMHIRIKRITDQNTLFEAYGKKFEIKLEYGENVSVTPLKIEDQIDKDVRSLSSLKVGESGKIIGISTAVRGKQRRRLLDFGIVPGTTITPRLVSFSGDPVAYNIRGASIALRREQAEMIFIEDERKEAVENE